jgi:hypothetical protein
MRGFAVIMFLCAASIHADVLVNIPFSNSTQSVVGGPVSAGATVDSRISLSSLTGGSGLISYQLQTDGTNSAEMAGDGTRWLGQSAGTSVGTLASAVSSNAYVEFTLSSGNPVHLTRLSFTVGGSGATNTGYVTVRSNAETTDFQTDLGTFSGAMNTKSGVKSIDLSLNADFECLTNVTFRFYLYDGYAGNNNRRAGFDDLKIEGQVLSALTLAHPSSSEVEPLSIPYFDWNDVVAAPFPGTYEIQIDDNSNFGSPVDVDEIPALISFYSPDFELTSGVTYYWRVRYKGAGGTALSWSTNQFTIATPYVVSVSTTDGWSQIRSKLAVAEAYTATNSGVAELRFPTNHTFNITQQHEAEDEMTDCLFYLSGAEDIILNGRGSKMMLTLDASGGNDQCGFFLARGSERIQLKNFTVDYTPDSIRQFGGQITALDKTNRTFTVEVNTNVYANLYEASAETNVFFLNEEIFQRVGFKGVSYGMLQNWGAAKVDTDTFKFTAEASTWGRYQEELKLGDYLVSDGRGGDLINLFNSVTDFVANNITANGCRGRYYIARLNANQTRCINNNFLRTGERLLGAPSGGINDHGGMSWYENVRIEHTRDDSFHCGESDTNGDELVLRNSEIDTAFRHSIWVQTDRSWIEGNYVENAGVSSMRLGPNGPPEEGTNGHLLVSALIKANVMVNGRGTGIVSFGSDYPDIHTGYAVNEHIQIVSNVVIDLQSDEAFLLEDLKDSVVEGNVIRSTRTGWRIYHDESKSIGYYFTNAVNVAGNNNWADDLRILSADTVVYGGQCTNVDVQAWGLADRLVETWTGLSSATYTSSIVLDADNDWNLYPVNFPVNVASNTALGSIAVGRTETTVLGDATGIDTHTAALSSSINPVTLPVRLRGSVVLGTLTTSGRAESRFGVSNSSTSEYYRVSFNNNTPSAPLSVDVNGTSLNIGAAGTQSSNEVWDFDVTFTRLGSSSTQVDYTIHKAGVLYASGSQTVNAATGSSTVFTQGFLQLRQRALIVYDDLWIFSYESSE